MMICPECKKKYGLLENLREDDKELRSQLQSTREELAREKEAHNKIKEELAENIECRAVEHRLADRQGRRAFEAEKSLAQAREALKKEIAVEESIASCSVLDPVEIKTLRAVSGRLKQILASLPPSVLQEPKEEICGVTETCYCEMFGLPEHKPHPPEAMEENNG